jgi:hypothetical protein
MKDTILTGWNFMRFLRLGIGLYVLIQSLLNAQYMLAFVGGVFIFQAVMNMGCAACAATPAAKVNPNANPDEVSFEEIK